MTRIDRRRFLAAMGLASGSLLLPSRTPARAGDGPQRLIVFYTQHGAWYDGWKMRPGGLGEETPWNVDMAPLSEAEMSAGLRPLHRHRARTTVVDGLALVSGEADRAGGFRHEIGQMHSLTGANMELVAGQLLAGAPSIDQIIADQIARPDRHRSLELGIGGAPISVNFRDRRLLLPMETSPARLHSRLFGLIDGEAGDDPVLAQQGSMLDKVRGRYDRLSQRLGAEDRQRLETHRDLVREVEQRVTGLMNASCGNIPGSPDAGLEGIPETFSAFTSLVTAAFACDLVRVVTMNVGTLDGGLIGLPGANLHDNYAHNLYSGNPDTAASARQAMTDYTAYHAQQVAELADSLDAAGLLDDTMILWVSELADGWHGFEKWPAIIVGGDTLRGRGKYHYFPSTTPFAGWGPTGPLPAMGMPHQKLLTSVAQAFGVGIDGLPVREVYGINDAKIDCTGVVEGLV